MVAIIPEGLNRYSSLQNPIGIFPGLLIKWLFRSTGYKKKCETFPEFFFIKKHVSVIIFVILNDVIMKKGF